MSSMVDDAKNLAPYLDTMAQLLDPIPEVRTVASKPRSSSARPRYSSKMHFAMRCRSPPCSAIYASHKCMGYRSIGASSSALRR